MGQAFIYGRSGGGVNQTLPPQIRNFAATPGNAQATLSWQLPELLDDYAGLRIVRKAGSAPTSHSDGIKIELSNTATGYTDKGLTNDTTYYYRSYPYNAKGQLQTELLVAYATPKVYPAVLADATWAEIDEAAQSGNIPATWLVGDTKDITLTTSELLTLQIYGFNHDDLTAGGKAGITFGLKNLMTATRRMNASDTNVNGFTGSEMYTWLQGDLYNSLPNDLKSVIKSVNKKTSAGNRSATINTNSMKIFLFSEVECFGTTPRSAAGEGSQYPIFTDDASRIKKLENGAGAVSNWWERSPTLSSTTSFCAVRNNGSDNYFVAQYSGGVCFGFCV